ncbi:MAG: vitamin K epoxide reductase family protein [Acidobacteriota bacterium]
MRYVIAFLAFAGLVVSFLAFRVHYSTAVQPCDINAHWDCGVVNHSPFSMIGLIPVAAVGMVGYVLIGVLAFFRRRALVLAAAIVGLIFAIHLSDIEQYVLMTWCLYCAISQGLILLISLLATGWVWLGKPVRGA